MPSGSGPVGRGKLVAGDSIAWLLLILEDGGLDFIPDGSVIGRFKFRFFNDASAPDWHTAVHNFRMDSSGKS